MSKAKSQRHSQRRGQRRSRRLANRGGAWYNPLSWFQKEEEQSYMSNLGMGMQPEEKPLLQSVGEGAQNLMQTADQKIVEASNAISSGVSSASQSVQDVLKTDVPITGSSEAEPSYSQPLVPASSFGGRRRRGRSQRQRGGKGGLGLTYYASPVHGMKVAEPTYWEEYKGGRSRRRTQRRSRGRGRGRGRGKSRSKSQRRH